MYLTDFPITSICIQERGYTFTINGYTKKMFGTLCVLSADNPASCACGGFKESTAAVHPCRHCMATRQNMNTKFNAKDFELRTPSALNLQVNELESASTAREQADISKKYGINFRSILNELQYFDVTCGSLIPDIMHDVLEGALQYETKLLLKQFILSDHNFTLVDLNQQIEGLELGYAETKSRPSPISHSTLEEKDGSLKQSG